MRTLDRNKQTISYATFKDSTNIVDGNGLFTGEHTNGYNTIQTAKVNVSAARGEASTELFGNDLNYQRTIVAEKDLGMDENSVVWINCSTSTPANYKVVSVAKSLNSVVYAIREVDNENPDAIISPINQ